MARQRIETSAIPTMRPEKAIPILEKHVIDAEELRQEPSDSSKRQQWINTGEGALIRALGTNPSIDAFGTAQCGVYNMYDTDETLREQANRQLDGMIAAIQSAIQQLRWELPDSSQIFLPAGSAHDAFVEVRKIIAAVSSDLLIVDPYVDETLWQLLTNMPTSATLRILTMQMKGDFVLEARKFASQHKVAIQIRTTSQFHDRFVLVDANRCWHLGASIKDAGNKAFLVSEIGTPSVRNTIIAHVQTTWSSASVTL